MRRLSRARLTARLREERGAVALMVALMVVPLIGCGAIATGASGIQLRLQ